MSFIDKLRAIFGKSAGKPAAPKLPDLPDVPEGTPAPPPPPPATVRDIKKVVVIGAGAMGSGIAAQIANAGVPVYMLDIVPPNATDRNILGKNALARMLKASPATDALNAGFMAPANADLITVGNREDNLAEAVKDADLIIEVIIENLEKKQELFADIERLRKPGSIVTSNTSTIPLRLLTEGRSDEFKEHFAITHFFNPPRFMQLLELISGPQTSHATKTLLREFCDLKLGKSVVDAKDTPGFIANRIGTYYLSRALLEAETFGMPIEVVDAVMGKPLGFPKDGVFGLVDLVGLGIIPSVTKSLKNNLSPTDAYQDIYREPKLVEEMLKDGRWGRNSPKGGFYRMVAGPGGKKVREALDLRTGQYKPVTKPQLAAVAAGKKGPRAVFEAGDEASTYAWNVMRDTLLYSVSLVPDVCDDIRSIDMAMRAGYNWKYGPFELLDKIGTEWFVRKLELEGVPVPALLKKVSGKTFYRVSAEGFDEHLSAEGFYQAEFTQKERLKPSDFKRGKEPLLANDDVSLWDMGDGVVFAELHGMKNTLGPGTMDMLSEAADLIEDSSGAYKALVIGNEGKDFAVGANLALASLVMNMGDQGQMDDILFQGQKTLERLKYANFPVVSAVSGLALGGGCEILLHSDAVQAHAESYIGLVEVGVGLIPAWGGCKEYLARCVTDAKKQPTIASPELRAFKTIGSAYVSTSAQEAKNNLFLKETDGITMNRERLLADAKAKALNLTEDYTPPKPFVFRTLGEGGQMAMRMGMENEFAAGRANWHDVRVSELLANVLTGGGRTMADVTTEQDLQRLEREGFLRATLMAETRARIQNTINTGKPLREKPLAVPLSPAQLRDSIPQAVLKERNDTGPVLKKTDAPAPATAVVPVADIKNMSTKELAGFVIEFVRTDTWKPEPPAGSVSDVFNKAAADTRQYWLKKISNLKMAASFTSSNARLLDQADGFLADYVAAQDKKLASADTPERKSEIQARRMVTQHYRDEIAKMKATL